MAMTFAGLATFASDHICITFTSGPIAARPAIHRGTSFIGIARKTRAPQSLEKILAT